MWGSDRPIEHALFSVEVLLSWVSFLNRWGGSAIAELEEGVQREGICRLEYVWRGVEMGVQYVWHPRFGPTWHISYVTDVADVTRHTYYGHFLKVTLSHVLLDFSLELQQKVGVGNFLWKKIFLIDEDEN